MTVKIGIVGAAGRMGRMLIEVVQGDDACALSLCADRIATTVGAVDVLSDARSVFEAADVVIDFTLPAATDGHAILACEYKTAWVLGTTGLSSTQEQNLAKVGTKIPVMYAANYSLGVNLLATLVKRAAAALDPSWDIEVVETHHNQKVDAPSGTALALGKAAAAGRDVDLVDVQKLSREGQTGARPVGEIGFATLRGGDVAGEHTVTLFGSQECIELGHRATSRVIFARGAVHAAKWLAGRTAPGLYDMNDVLGLD